ncbi:SpoVR family protein [Bordetella sp. 02P26C-1]|uniref:SpoVR family protein n=1 Tax=Bordetella sp. 02P26C-1 TaxID=2683195 RepID=UPI0013548FFC|nr:SpoVR family protein [Bordetella sp. 02P26C-1]MVW78349.1 SpoVR family protein [Bordetella sp. 02P26C-1]
MNVNALTGADFPRQSTPSARPISEGSEWTFELIQRYDEAIAEVAQEFGLDTYPNQIEVITSEQMLDAYASGGLPIGYPHWSYGKEFIRNEQYYRRGMQGLAYEIVINSNPCIAYLMEENTMAMQALVIAHACYGHNSFFKGNYLFRQWTDADSILDYLVFARKYVMDCESRYGIDAVEAIIDSCHALSPHGVDRYKRPMPISYKEEAQRQAEREEHARLQYNDLWRTLPRVEPDLAAEKQRSVFPPEPEENLLYFIEKHSPKLEPWQKELVRIVRKIAQYFYPQGQTKVMNEGWATFWHYTILNRLHEKGLVNDGFMMEFLQSHTNVVSQRGFDERGYGGINPYALGFAMMQDIRRICEAPTDEDRKWFPDIAGSDWRQTLDFAMRNFKDESFISQYLSPRLIREFRFFAIADHEAKPVLEIAAIHDDEGYRQIRKLLAEQHNRDNHVPDIQIVRYRRESDRSLVLRHQRTRGRPLATEDADQVMKHLGRLWGFKVRLEETEGDGKVIAYREVNAAAPYREGL